jgi:hypothetical protein
VRFQLTTDGLRVYRTAVDEMLTCLGFLYQR